jgi:hypothetical protein
MAKKQFDGVIEAVHYTPDGQVDWARVYVRRGPTWSDRLILPREELIREIKAGRKMYVGSRIEGLAGTFDTGDRPVRVVGKDGSEVLVTSNDRAEADSLDGAPII